MFIVKSKPTANLFLWNPVRICFDGIASALYRIKKNVDCLFA